MKYAFKRKPRKCPACGSSRVASILYGMPAYDEKLREELDQGKIALGGCLLDPGGPVWMCADCKTDIYRSWKG